MNSSLCMLSLSRFALVGMVLLSISLYGCGEDEPADLDPSQDVALSSESTATATDGSTYSVGFDQVSGNNQNPFVEKRDADGNTLWRVAHESTPVDGRATIVAVNDNTPYVVFTVDGGSNDGDYITKKAVEDGAFSGVFANSYGSGGGPKVSILAELNPATGDIRKASFVTARLTNGNTNTLRITGVGFNAGNVAFSAESAAWPPGTGSSYARMPDITDEDRVDGAFQLYYEMSSDFSGISRAELR